MKRVPKFVWIGLAVLAVGGVAACFLPVRKVTSSLSSGEAGDK